MTNEREELDAPTCSAKSCDTCGKPFGPLEGLSDDLKADFDRVKTCADCCVRGLTKAVQEDIQRGKDYEKTNDEIKAPDYIPAMCLRDAAAMIESLVQQRDYARLQAVIERDKHCHPDHGGHLFSWENAV